MLLLSCQSNVICPAFQSTYILDDSVREAHFSYVWQLDEFTRDEFLNREQPDNTDTTNIYITKVEQPKVDYYAYAEEHSVVPWREVNKTKYGMIKNVFYPIKKYRLRTSPMKNVYAPEELSNEITSDELYDSLIADTLNLTSQQGIATTDTEADEVDFLYQFRPDDNFNVEQQYYLKYFGDRLIANREPPKPLLDSLGNPVIQNNIDSLASKKPFFQRIFDFFSFSGGNKTDSLGATFDEGLVEDAIDSESEIANDTL